MDMVDDATSETQARLGKEEAIWAGSRRVAGLDWEIWRAPRAL
jgi:hypothetical protein